MATLVSFRQLLNHSSLGVLRLLVMLRPLPQLRAVDENRQEMLAEVLTLKDPLNSRRECCGTFAH